MSISDLITVNINSSLNNIISGTTDNFTYQVSLPADLLQQFNAVSVISWSLPKSFYQINENNNDFVLNEDNQAIPLSITPGNYNLQQWFTYLSNLLTSSSTHGVTYVVSFQYSTLDNGIMMITANNSSIPIYLYFGDTSLSYIFGFDQNSFNDFNAGVLLSKYVINLNESNTVYLNSNIIASPFNDATSQSSNTLAVMYTGSYRNNSFITQWYDIISNMKRFAGKNAIFTFNLVDEYNDPVNLHGVEQTFILALFRYTPNMPLYKKLNFISDVYVEKEKHENL